MTDWQSGGAYVAEFKNELGDVARKLGLQIRYNHERKCAELYMSDDWSEQVIARVRVTGEVCSAECAHIISQQSLPDATKALFEKALSRVMVRFEVQP